MTREEEALVYLLHLSLGWNNNDNNNNNDNDKNINNDNKKIQRGKNKVSPLESFAWIEQMTSSSLSHVCFSGKEGNLLENISNPYSSDIS